MQPRRRRDARTDVYRATSTDPRRTTRQAARQVSEPAPALFVFCRWWNAQPPSRVRADQCGVCVYVCVCVHSLTHTAMPAWCPAQELALPVPPSDWLSLSASDATASLAGALLPAHRRFEVQALVEALRAADERTLLSQIESFLRLYQLRDLLQTIEAEHDRAQGKPHARPRSVLFASFLEWAYGKEEGAARNSQLKRLAHWFHWQREVAFYQRLLSQDDCADGSPATGLVLRARVLDKSLARDASKSAGRTRRAALSLSYFFELAPRLPQLLQSHSRATAPVESRLRAYLAVRPLTQLRVVLASDFGHQRAVDSSTSVVRAGAGEEQRPLQSTGHHQPIHHLVDAAMTIECAEAISSSSSLPPTPSRSTRSSAAGAAEKPHSDETRLSRTSSTSTAPLGDSDVYDSDMSHDDDANSSDTHADDRVPLSSARAAAATATGATVLSASRKRPREARSTRRPGKRRRREAPVKSNDADESAAATTPPPHIACIGASAYVPIDLLRMGVAAWERQRKSAGVDAQYRSAMDGALIDLMWDLSDQLSDGARLELPEFQRARRSASREVAEKHSARMEGQRRCTTLQDVLDKLAEKA